MLQLSMSIATMEEEIVGFSARLWDSNFQNIVTYNFEFPQAWVATSRLSEIIL